MELRTSNVHQLLPVLLNELRAHGVKRESRNSDSLGSVLVYPEVVTIVYERPWERVMLWPERDCNPAMHLYESIWMLSGRNDLASLARYSKRFKEFSDDGATFHGAYGERWRKHFNMDQLYIIVERLRKNSEDRRCVLQMWDSYTDLDRNGKDVPCNLIATLQVDHMNLLNLTVFNRSNDLVWGLTGANAVHFSFMQEYLAQRIGCGIGKYTQVTANLHGYQKTMTPLEGLTQVGEDPYSSKIEWIPLPQDLTDLWVVQNVADCGTFCELPTQWGKTAMAVLHANFLWRNSPKDTRYAAAMTILDRAPNQKADWVVAQREWFERRAK